ncbi:MAG: ABC transporter permease subunit [Rectinema sp.]
MQRHLIPKIVPKAKNCSLTIPKNGSNHGSMAAKKSKIRLRIAQNWQLYVILFAPFLWLIIFRYVPMYGLQLAFKNFRSSRGIWGSPWVGLAHFKRFFTSPSSWMVIRNTVTLSLYSIAASFPFAIILALCLNEMRNEKSKKFIQTVTYAPYFISTVVMVSIVFQILDPRIGIINRIIMLFGGKSINFMAMPQYFSHIYVWSGVWQSNGYNAIIYLAALSAVNPELHEAAIVDGCNKFQRIWYIDLPQIKPTIIIMLILNMGYVMSIGFEKVYLMQNPLNIEASEVMSTYIYRVGLINFDYSYSTAIGFINSIINLVLLLTVNTVAKKLGEEGLW